MKNKSGSIQIYRLPNHSWFPADWYPHGSQYDKPEFVVRRTTGRVLIRESTWSAAKKGRRYNYSKKFCGENHPNETWESDKLYVWGHTTIGLLGQRAKDGNADAAEELWRLTVEATGLLTQICKTKPELLRPLARINRQWPVFKKKNEELSDNERDLFAAIQLGADDFIELDAQTAKWIFDDAGIVAYSLLTYVRAARGDEPTETIFEYGNIGKCARKHLLRGFDQESAAKWWKFAKEILLFSYPKPHAIEELNQLVPIKIRSKKNGQMIDNPKRKSDGRIDAAIFRVLKSRFLSFARNSSFDKIPACPTSDA